MKMHRYTLVRLVGPAVERMAYIGPSSGLPEGWSVHKRCAVI